MKDIAMSQLWGIEKNRIISYIYIWRDFPFKILRSIFSLSSSSFINHYFFIIFFTFLSPASFFHSPNAFSCEKKINKKSTLLPSGSHLSLIPFPLPCSSNKPPVDCNHTPVCSDACLSRQPTTRPILTLLMKAVVLMAVEHSTSYL